LKKNSNYILYISCVCSPNLLDKIFERISDKSGLAIQKFHRLLLEGFGASEDNRIETLSTIPIAPSNHQKKIWNLKWEIEQGVRYNYIPIINLPIVKNCIVFFYSFFKFLFWKFPKGNGKQLIICDVLSFTITSAAFFAFKIRGKKRIGVVTDIPGINVRRKKLTNPFFNFFLQKYDNYVLLTKYMNAKVNPSGKPFIIMEGLVNRQMLTIQNTLKDKSNERIVMYAGGLYEKYGILNLIHAFMRLKSVDIKLFLFGEGELVPMMGSIMKSDSRIVYKGVLQNSEVVKLQLKATLLVNPRPSSEEFSKYSFPSKNMEYMVSGTPLATTLLPGLPRDYLDFVYIITDESEDGIHSTLEYLLSKSDEELFIKGAKAKEFVLKHKNNVLQAKRILDSFD
jgi:hypothetical protein